MDATSVTLFILFLLLLLVIQTDCGGGLHFLFLLCLFLLAFLRRRGSRGGRRRLHAALLYIYTGALLPFAKDLFAWHCLPSRRTQIGFAFATCATITAGKPVILVFAKPLLTKDILSAFFDNKTLRAIIVWLCTRSKFVTTRQIV